MLNLTITSNIPLVNTVRTPSITTYAMDKPVTSFTQALKTLQDKATVYNPQNSQPDTDLRVDSVQVEGDVVFEFTGFESETRVLSNPIITRTGGTKIPEPILGACVLPPAMSSESMQKTIESSPDYLALKKQSDAAQVELVARDNNGQIVAVLWKDGSTFAENVGVIGNTPIETKANLLKMPNVHLERYQANEKSPTRQDIQTEQLNFAKKHPELFQQFPSTLLT
ncbi:MAG: hypothetical protein NTZ45_02700 [Methylococcales bacterium]|nr:hypothetical protein [Methylococcales bacterium]